MQVAPAIDKAGVEDGIVPELPHQVSAEDIVEADRLLLASYFTSDRRPRFWARSGS